MGNEAIAGPDAIDPHTKDAPAPRASEAQQTTPNGDPNSTIPDAAAKKEEVQPIVDPAPQSDGASQQPSSPPAPEKVQTPPTFNHVLYSAANPDVVGTKAFITEHFLRRAPLEGRKSRPMPAIPPDTLGIAEELPGWRFKLAESSHALPSEDQAKNLFRARARMLVPNVARNPLDFSVTGKPNLSVIIVVHNNFELTIQTLVSLRSSYSGAVEVVLVDSGSTDETVFISRYIVGAKILRFVSNIGYVVGCNTAFSMTEGENILLINNDIEIVPGAVDAALRRLHLDPKTAAVGAKLVRVHGALQEAGSMIWCDGSTVGYMRDQNPMLPEANFVRMTDYCSAAFLLLKRQVIDQVGLYDEEFAPAYCEDVDLCLRIRAAGYAILYDPAVVVHHLEFGSSDPRQKEAMAAMLRNRAILTRKHLKALRAYPVPALRGSRHARDVHEPARRLLFIEDWVPLRIYGSGFTRSNDIVTTMVELGWKVTLFPINPRTYALGHIARDIPDEIEVLHDHDIRDLSAFLQRSANLFDVIWVARTHNLYRIKSILDENAAALAGARLILDTEAIDALRVAEQQRVLSKPAKVPLREALEWEFRAGMQCQAIVAVNEAEAAVLRDLGHSDVVTLGHVRDVNATARAWQDRSGLLFVGALHSRDAPNADALYWFVGQVLPLVTAALGADLVLTIAGFVDEKMSMGLFNGHPNVRFVGNVDDLQPYYDAARVFVAPTRFAAGIPYKVHEAASFGVPVVMTTLLLRQLSWQNEREALAADASDPDGFAQAVIRMYTDEAVWNGIRGAALRRLQDESSRDSYRATLAELLA